MTARNDTRTDHLELSLYAKVNRSPELSAARSSGWKKEWSEKCDKKGWCTWPTMTASLFLVHVLCRSVCVQKFCASLFIKTITSFSFTCVTTRRSWVLSYKLSQCELNEDRSCSYLVPLMYYNISCGPEGAAIAVYENVSTLSLGYMDTVLSMRVQVSKLKQKLKPK